MIGRRSHDDSQAFDDAWNGHTPRDEQIADLVHFAENLCEAAVAVEPSTAFRDSLRAQLMTEAATVLVPMPTRPRPAVSAPAAARPVRRRVAAVTAALVATAGTIGIVASSASAVPGEMLYPVKRSVESVELQLHRDDASRGAFQLAQASERLAEVRRLSADGRSTELIASTLQDFSASAADGSSKLFTAYTSTGKEKSIRQVNDFAAASSVDLSALSAELPDSVSDAFTAATEAVTNLATKASSLCAACAPADVRALVSAVTDLPTTAPVATPKTTAKPAATAPAPSDKAPSSTSTSAPATSGSTPATPAVTTGPAPAPTVTKTPTLSDVTEPLIGGLLGNGDDKVGLVPGLLNGLLGGGKPVS